MVTQTLREGGGQSHDKGKPVFAAGDQGQGAEVVMSSFRGHRCVWLRSATKSMVADA